MPAVLRVVYSRFAAQEILYNKLEPAARLADHGYLDDSEAPEAGANPQTVQLIKGSANVV